MRMDANSSIPMDFHRARLRSEYFDARMERRMLTGDPVALGRQRCSLLSRLTGVEAEAIWQWGFIERFVNGLLYCEIGPKENAAEFLTVVEAWAEAEVD
jgi:hypothetical protein